MLPTTRLLILCACRDVDLHAPPKRALIAALAAHAVCPPERAKLTEIAASSEESAGLGTVADVLEVFGSCRPPIGTLLQLLPKVMPRSYTASSSHLQSPEHVHLTFNLHSFYSAGMLHQGLCTNYLKTVAADRANIRCRLSSSDFDRFLVREPTLSAPIIMVATGTGIAPMRALLHHKKKLSGSLSNMHLFFGCCHPDKDFIYEDELKEMQKAGLTLYPAFSRLTDEKVYVQHLLNEKSAWLFKTMSADGGYLLGCGGTGMGCAVFQVLIKSGEECGGFSRQQSQEWANGLAASGHCVQELWS